MSSWKEVNCTWRPIGDTTIKINITKKGSRQIQCKYLGEKLECASPEKPHEMNICFVPRHMDFWRNITIPPPRQEQKR